MLQPWPLLSCNSLHLCNISYGCAKSTFVTVVPKASWKSIRQPPLWQPSALPGSGSDRECTWSSLAAGIFLGGHTVSKPTYSLKLNVGSLWVNHKLLGSGGVLKLTRARLLMSSLPLPEKKKHYSKDFLVLLAI